MYENEYLRKNNARFDGTAHQQVVLGDGVGFVFNDLFFIYGEEYRKKMQELSVFRVYICSLPCYTWHLARLNCNKAYELSW